VWSLGVDAKEASMFCSSLLNKCEGLDMKELEGVFEVNSYMLKTGPFALNRLFDLNMTYRDIVFLGEFDTYEQYLNRVLPRCVQINHLIYKRIEKYGIEIGIRFKGGMTCFTGLPEGEVDFDEITKLADFFGGGDDNSQVEEVPVHCKVVRIVDDLYTETHGDVQGKSLIDYSVQEVPFQSCVVAIQQPSFEPVSAKEVIIARQVLYKEDDLIPFFVDVNYDYGHADSEVGETSQISLTTNDRLLLKFEGKELAERGYDYHKLTEKSYDNYCMLSGVSLTKRLDWDDDIQFKLFCDRLNKWDFERGVTLYYNSKWFIRLKSRTKFYKLMMLSMFYYVGGDGQAWDWLIKFGGGMDIDSDHILVAPKLYKLFLLRFSIRAENLSDMSLKEFFFEVLSNYGFDRELDFRIYWCMLSPLLTYEGNYKLGKLELRGRYSYLIDSKNVDNRGVNCLRNPLSLNYDIVSIGNEHMEKLLSIDCKRFDCVPGDGSLQGISFKYNCEASDKKLLLLKTKNTKFKYKMVESTSKYICESHFQLDKLIARYFKKGFLYVCFELVSKIQFVVWTRKNFLDAIKFLFLEDSLNDLYKFPIRYLFLVTGGIKVKFVGDEVEEFIPGSLIVDTCTGCVVVFSNDCIVVDICEIDAYK
jgi:hypothetical protein